MNKIPKNFWNSASGKTLISSLHDSYWDALSSLSAIAEALQSAGADANSTIAAELQQAALETTIKEALLADPYGRTVEVKDFTWVWGVQSIHMHCTVVGQDDRTAQIEYDIPLNRKEE